MLHLKTITKDNWLKAISLRVREDQVKFVASNAMSLAQLNFLENFHAKGIYHGEEMIGFSLYGIDEDNHEYWICRMMITISFAKFTHRISLRWRRPLISSSSCASSLNIPNFALLPSS